MLVLPELRCQVVRRADPLHFFLLLALRGALTRCRVNFGRLLTDAFKDVGRLMALHSTTNNTAIGFVFNLLYVAEVAQFSRVVFREEYVERFDVTMDHVPRVQVVHTQANVNEHLPKKVVREELSLLLLDGSAEVAMLAVLHDYANGLLCDKTVVVADYEMAVYLRHDLDLLHRLECHILRQYTHIDLLDHVVLICVHLTRFI